MPITELLTRTDGSAGRVKTQRRPSPNRSHYWPFDELNKVLDWVVAASGELGLSDGTTVGSILAKLRSLPNPRSAKTVVFSDFLEGTVSTSLTDIISTVVASGSVSFVASGSASDGAGLLRLIGANSASSSARARKGQDTVAGRNLPVFRSRFKTPASLADCECRLGLGNAADTVYARFAVKSAGTLYLQQRSALGGVTVDQATAVVLGPSTWYEARIELSPGAFVTYYLNDAVIGTVSTANSVPQNAEAMTPFDAFILRNAAGPHVFDIDWFETELTRA